VRAPGSLACATDSTDGHLFVLQGPRAAVLKLVGLDLLGGAAVQVSPVNTRSAENWIQAPEVALDPEIRTITRE
jgi:hypothetical protein